MKFKSGHKQLGVNASIMIDASIERLGLSADISPINKLAAAIELGDFIIHKQIDESVLVVDGSTTIDTFVMNFFKSLSDTVAPTDSVALSVEKPLAEDALDLGDYVTLFTNKAPDDVVGTSDSIDKFDTTKGLNHTTAIRSHVATALSKSLQDSAALTHTLTLLTDKSFLDGSAATDKTVLITEKHLDDITVFTDDAVLLSQGYVNDAFYFADDYTGTSRTG